MKFPLSFLLQFLLPLFDLNFKSRGRGIFFISTKISSQNFVYLVSDRFKTIWYHFDYPLFLLSFSFKIGFGNIYQQESQYDHKDADEKSKDVSWCIQPGQKSKAQSYETQCQSQYSESNQDKANQA